MPKSRTRRPPQRRPAPRRPAAAVPVTVVAPGVRGAVERRSAPVLTWLTSRPRLLLPVVSLALLIAGLTAPAVVGVPLLLVLLLVVAWLSYLSWPVVQGGAKLVRLVTLGAIVAAVVSRLVA